MRVPILDGLSDLRDSMENPHFREIIASPDPTTSKAGRPCRRPWKRTPKVFDKVFVSLIRAGETTGRLPEVLRNLTETLKWEDELASQTKKLAMYPAFVGIIVDAPPPSLMVMMPAEQSLERNIGDLPANEYGFVSAPGSLLVSAPPAILVMLVGLRIVLTIIRCPFRFDVQPSGTSADSPRRSSSFVNTFACCPRLTPFLEIDPHDTGRSRQSWCPAADMERRTTDRRGQNVVAFQPLDSSPWSSACCTRVGSTRYMDEA